MRGFLARPQGADYVVAVLIPEPMSLRRIADRAFELPIVYRAIQAPWADEKLAPCLRDLPDRPDVSVLDVGCGPGTNAAHFAKARYTGIDINADYIASAKRRMGNRFLVGDVTDPSVFPAERFDCVLANSLMHHLSDDETRHVLAHLPRLVADGGKLYIIDLVKPPNVGLPRLMAQLDRGRFTRPVERWHELFNEAFAIEAFIKYPLGVGPFAMWEFVYCRGVPR